ncbi:MAG: hypothetical protein EZS28_008748 [Streblomastix strix]|uniref:Uncharacterized protein n=1 Tax=Streblomastix strix TaxID=222440 RepID=A0A5J4WL05_9EUKA|nr:MAG: hypothetical protein EZS28_008748 [Streblomastix strix]
MIVTKYPASFKNVIPSPFHSLFVIPTPFRPPAPALFVVNSCNYTAATLAGLGLQRYIEEIPGVVLNIDFEKRELMLARWIIKNDFHVDVSDGAITMKDEADAIRLQTFIHKPTQPGEKKWLEDEDEIVRYYYFDHPLKIDANIDQLQIFEQLAFVCSSALVKTTLLLYVHAINNHLHMPLCNLKAIKYAIRVLTNQHQRIHAFVQEQFIHLSDNVHSIHNNQLIFQHYNANGLMVMIQENVVLVLQQRNVKNYYLNQLIEDVYVQLTIKPKSYTCTSAIHPDNEQACVYDENKDATYNLDNCRETKICTNNNTSIGCSCADNGPIQTGECKCSQLHHLDGCTLVKCFDKYQEFPCLCTHEHKNDTDECVCPSNDLASLLCVCSTTLESNPQDCTINNCLANSDTTVTKYSCYCTKDNHPAKYRCPSLTEDLQGIPVEQCQLLVDNDPREGGACPITRLCQIDDDLSTPCLCSEDFHQDNCICSPIYHPSTYGQAPFDCTCPQNDIDDSYTKTECEDEIYSAIDYCDESDSPSIYQKSCICIDGNSPEKCVCPQDSKDLIGVPVAQCECCSTGDPRSGLTTPGAGCPEYCTDNIYNGSCTSDSDLTDYTECEADKAYSFLFNCNGVHGSSVKPNTCKYIDRYTPTGCTCPKDTDLNQLDGVPPGQCKCLDQGDP